MSWGYHWKPYVPVAQRRAKARRQAEKMAKKGQPLASIEISGRKIATTFWGQAWCQNLERYSDYANRLPRGRTYVRNGSVIDLKIEKGVVKALVSGSELYKVKVQIDPLAQAVWKKIKVDCSQSIDSLIDLLQGRFSQGVMQRLTRQEDGLFPQPKAIKISCSCPDWAGVCKHVAAVFYGVGARLDNEPQLLFTLRDLDHLELIHQAGENLDQATAAAQSSNLAGEDLEELFGIELEGGSAAPAASTTRPVPRRRRAAAQVKTAQPKSAKVRTAAKRTGPAKASATAVVAAAAPKSKRRRAALSTK